VRDVAHLLLHVPAVTERVLLLPVARPPEHLLHRLAHERARGDGTREGGVGIRDVQ
jgi:hypothetical protein